MLMRLNDRRTALAALPTGSPPSTYAAYAAVTGEPGGWARVVGTTALRAGIIGAGLYVAGHRQGLVRSSLYASAAIEVAVLLYAFSVASKTP
jgi:hypothetical protein